MPDLTNKNVHMRGQTVLCNGRKYAIDQRGIATGVLPEDARKLVQAVEWRLANPADARELDRVPDGQPTAADLRAWEKQANEELSELRGELAAALDMVQTLKEKLEAQEEPEAEAIDAPPPGDPEADPLESMEVESLKALADSMSVPYGPNIGKALLVERIKEAKAAQGAP